MEPSFAKEIQLDYQHFLHKINRRITPVGEVFREITSPASRYRIPLAVQDQLVFSLRNKMAELAGLDDYPVLSRLRNDIPQNWQILLNYLYRQGFISRPYITIEELYNDEPKIYSLRLWGGSLEGKTDGTYIPISGYARGVSRDINEAFSKVVGELLERFSLLIYRERDLLRGSVGQLKKKGDPFLDPSILAGASEEQKRKHPGRIIAEESMFRWAKGKSLMTGREAWIPAQLTFWNYRVAIGEPYVQQPITNGAGGYFTHEGAILSGLYELIQRDAFLIFWLNKIAPPRIDLNSFQNTELRELVNDFTRYNFRLEILDITSDFGIPAFAAFILDETKGGPVLSVGGGCSPDPGKAIIRAITEAMGVYHWLRTPPQNEPFELPEPYEPFSLPLGQRDRLVLWGSTSMKNKFEFFLKGPLVALESQRLQKQESRSEKDELSVLMEEFRKRGKEYEIFIYEAKNLVLEELGYHAVRVVVPSLIPLYLNEIYAPLGAKRLKDVPLILGQRPTEEVNPLPHPFP